MNSWLILLVLLSCNRIGSGNGRDYDCGYGQGEPRRFPGGRDWDGDNDCGRNRDNDCESGRGRERDFERGSDRNRDCDCDTDRDSRGYNNNESRFDPRYDSRPFNNSDCGCDNQ